jgi:hypothetical protein
MQNDNKTYDSIALATSPPVVIPNSTTSKTTTTYSGLFYWLQSNKKIPEEKKEITEENNDVTDIDTISNPESEDMFPIDDLNKDNMKETLQKEEILEEKDDSSSEEESDASSAEDEDIVSGEDYNNIYEENLDDFEEDLMYLKFGNRFYEFNDYVRRNRKIYRKRLSDIKDSCSNFYCYFDLNKFKNDIYELKDKCTVACDLFEDKVKNLYLDNRDYLTSYGIATALIQLNIVYMFSFLFFGYIILRPRYNINHDFEITELNEKCESGDEDTSSEEEERRRRS